MASIFWTTDAPWHFAIGIVTAIWMSGWPTGRVLESVCFVPASTDIQKQSKSVKTLRAGEGFLGQSTKWLHFGLGSSNRIERVIVRWPGGESQEFSGLTADAYYRMVQGSETAERLSMPTDARSLVASASPPTVVSDQAQVLLTSRLLMPSLKYQTFLGSEEIVEAGKGRAVLLNLWATWCLPCLAELSGFVEEESQLRDAGLDIVAVAVDQLDEKAGADSVAIEGVLRKLRFPFRSGIATSELIDVLQAVHDELFLAQRALPVPVSLLIDSSGRLAAIYKGPVIVERLLADVEKLRFSGDTWRDAALPFTGRWFEPVQPLRDAQLVSTLAKQGHLDLMQQYISRHRPMLSKDTAFAELLSQLGNQLVARGDTDAGLPLLEEALAAKPDVAQSYFNVAVANAQNGDVPKAIRRYIRAMRLIPNMPTRTTTWQ